MRFHVGFFAIALLLTINAPASAQSLAAIQQIGIAEFSSLRKSFYLAGVSAENTTSNEKQLLTTGGQAKRIDIKIVADTYSQRRFAQQWSRSLIVSASQDELLEFDQALVRFQHLLDEPFQQGDTISVEADIRGESKIFVNGIKAFDVKKPGFLELLLTTWIGEKPPSSTFKQSILEDAAPATLKQQFAALNPEPERVEAIRSALERQ